jgi:DHA1 family tetracycline resistance protein-like MFS transporter
MGRVFVRLYWYNDSACAGFINTHHHSKLGQERSVYVGLTLYSIGFILFAFATQGWEMFLFMIPYALGGIAGPALQGIISSHVPANEQGELQGALTSLMSCCAIFGPLM